VQDPMTGDQIGAVTGHEDDQARVGWHTSGLRVQRLSGADGPSGSLSAS
jgi:hypothetical protein